MGWRVSFVVVVAAAGGSFLTSWCCYAEVSADPWLLACAPGTLLVLASGRLATLGIARRRLAEER